jgi:histidinol phosphatase-like PHP family hydrolase
MTPSLDNRTLVELLAGDAHEPGLADQRRRALRRAARAALAWPEEAHAIHAAGRPLTELRYVGPWLAAKIRGWLETPPAGVEPPPLRRGFSTMATANAFLAAHPDAPALRGDLQTHTLDSDGTAPVEAMAEAALEEGHEYLAITDHSQGLKIAHGMDEARLAAQGEEIARVNAELDARGARLRILRAIEMNLSPAGEGDMDLDALRRLDLVLGAFHSKLRTTDDQTERYLAALDHPAVHVLAHPRGRIFDFRAGLRADWRRVFDAAAERDRAVEIDAYPDRQDLDAELLDLARASGVRISIGSDAHAPYQLRFARLGLATALAAGIPGDRILNCMPRDALLSWGRALRPE